MLKKSLTDKTKWRPMTHQRFATHANSGHPEERYSIMPVMPS